MKDIIGYEGLYAITSCGRVWSYKRKRFLKPYPNQGGYLRVDLRKDGKRKTCSVHRLVAEAYIPNPGNKVQVNHKDEMRSHNWVNNLEWVTSLENNIYGNHLNNVRKIVYCIELDKVFESATAAASFIGRSASRVSECCLGKTKTCGGYHWRYVE